MRSVQPELSISNLIINFEELLGPRWSSANTSSCTRNDFPFNFPRDIIYPIPIPCNIVLNRWEASVVISEEVVSRNISMVRLMARWLEINLISVWDCISKRDSGWNLKRVCDIVPHFFFKFYEWSLIRI